MKRSKIFLGASSLILAVAAIAATKANQTPSIKGYYSIPAAQGGTGNCTVLGATNCTVTGNNLCTISTGSRAGQQLFTYKAAPCANALLRP